MVGLFGACLATEEEMKGLVIYMIDQPKLGWFLKLNRLNICVGCVTYSMYVHIQSVPV